MLAGIGPAGPLACVAARERGADGVVSVVPSLQEARLVEGVGAAIPAVADLSDPLATATAVREGLGGFADLAVVCADVAGAEGGALLATRPGGTAVFAASPMSFAGLTNVSRWLGGDVELLVASGQVSGAPEAAFELLRTYPALRTLVGRNASPPSASSTSRPDRP